MSDENKQIDDNKKGGKKQGAEMGGDIASPNIGASEKQKEADF